MQASRLGQTLFNQGKLVLDAGVGELAGEEGSRVITVALRSPPLPEELSMLDGVEQVEVLDGQRFRLSASNGDEVSEELVKLSVENDWGLFELVPESGTLEQTFLKLTSGQVSTTLQEEQE